MEGGEKEWYLRIVPMAYISYTSLWLRHFH